MVEHIILDFYRYASQTIIYENNNLLLAPKYPRSKYLQKVLDKGQKGCEKQVHNQCRTEEQQNSFSPAHLGQAANRSEVHCLYLLPQRLGSLGSGFNEAEPADLFQIEDSQIQIFPH